MRHIWIVLLLAWVVSPAVWAETTFPQSTPDFSVSPPDCASLEAEIALPRYEAHRDVFLAAVSPAVFEEALDASGSLVTDPAATAKPGKPLWAGDPTRFFEGAFTAFLNHETGHLLANAYLGTHPYLKSVQYGPIPFFTIEPGRPVTRHEHYATASAGFNAQNLLSEWILTKHPRLADAEDEPFLKGMYLFNFWLGVGYAATAFANYGPDERDTKGMADSLRWNERTVGLMVLTPTILDMYRYRHPDCKWARTASRLSKLLIIGLAFGNHD